MEEQKNAEAKRILDTYFRPRVKHSLSASMPENKLPCKTKEEQDVAYREYNNFLVDYSNELRDSEKYSIENPNLAKTDFISENPSICWKVHLNATPENVKVISEYLQQNGYFHKYLSGGGPEDGKVFTVYIGSYKLTQKLAKEMSEGIGGYLSKPIDHQEIELSKGIVGRFCGNTIDFQQYGSAGLSWVNKNPELLKFISDVNKKNNTHVLGSKTPGPLFIQEGLLKELEEYERLAEVISFKKAKELYGDYFFKEEI